ncbi:crotonobetainyl-CoA--carnitine CoA-transferase [Rhodopirellula sp. P2]|uniref:crotonobetainyl-CoA--carnitine CoA-transferase n=1 Tax=Rhodopirellula sp. P2 TaxID=2127060 RepID=UPI00236867CA|nr:crotonobetainyl-CoA--carnitine CoA-transferase [Rhodopirellula sp. P2]WDQ19331.1 crotonobetainyl-CoA--carnitine CoA-transferase [Rhodopirellula sp. P2]
MSDLCLAPHSQQGRWSVVIRVVAAWAMIAGIVCVGLNHASAQSCGCGEPACGMEPACGCEAPLAFPALRAQMGVSCGCETQCSSAVEPVCGAEPVCGVEPFFASEPSCGSGVTCGCETAGCSSCRKADSGGFLGRHQVQKCNPIYQTLDLAACSVERVLEVGANLVCGPHRHRGCESGCQTCSHCESSMGGIGAHEMHSYGHHTVIEAPVVIDSHSRPYASNSTVTEVTPYVQHQPSVQAIPTPAPQLQRTPLTDGPKTTIRKSANGLPAIPKPVPTQSSPTRGSKERAGSLFDEMRNPFEDDSARVSRRRVNVRQTSFEGGEPESVRRISRPIRKAATQPSEADDFADYFRK